MIAPTIFIDTVEGVKNLLDLVTTQMIRLDDSQSLLYIDLEGERLSRQGNISLMTVLFCPVDEITTPYIIDIFSLGNMAFMTLGREGKSLKHILESPRIFKAFFDVRNDSDALHAHYGIRLQGIRDIQLMESARRPTESRRRFVSGPSSCIEGILDKAEREKWKRCKTEGERLWNPQKGGSYSVFNVRPLSHKIIAYCIGDVQYLPVLYSEYRKGAYQCGELVAKESQNRVALPQEPGYQHDGVGRARSPWTDAQHKLLDSWGAPTLEMDYFSWCEDNYDEEWDEYYESERETANDFEDWTRAPWQGPPS